MLQGNSQLCSPLRHNSSVRDMSHGAAPAQVLVSTEVLPGARSQTHRTRAGKPHFSPEAVIIQATVAM